MWSAFKTFLIKLIKYTCYLLIMASIAGMAFLYISPQFGGKATAEKRAEYQQSPHFADGKFRNLEKIIMEFNLNKVKGLFHALRNRPDNLEPKQTLQSLPFELTNIRSVSSPAQVTWLSHSAFLIHIDGKRILLDPMLGEAAAPLPWFVKRFNTLPISAEQLSDIDAVLISHDHYDHLDYGSIKTLNDNVAHFYVPLGVGNHLQRWGVPEHKITELDWWQEARLDKSPPALTVAFTPSRHTSGRGITDHKSTLWGSWAIIGSTEKVFFSGDGGYGTHFKKIGDTYGAFDIALMECGQYNPNWKNVHMTPEESIQAVQDINAKLTMPIHWGAFVLSTHSWVEPAERCVAAAHAKQLNIATPRIGETLTLGQDYPQTPWWRAID